MRMAEALHSTGRRWLSIIGIGEDGVAGLSPAAQRLIASAELVVGGKRHLELARTLITGRTLSWPSPIGDALPEIDRDRGRPVAVLASGDPFHYGVGDLLMRRFCADDMVCLPQPSAFSLAAARLGWQLQDTALVSLHGRALEGIVRHLQPGARVLALSWDATTPAKLARLLTERGMSGSSLTVLESLGGPKERVHRDVENASALNIIALEVVADAGATVVPLTPGLDDSQFEHDGQLTKREVRAVTLSALAPGAGELLWDVGLGAGSIAIEWLLRHPSLRAIGVEADSGRAACATRNAAKLGAPDLKIVEGRAPWALKDLPAPHAVFIGGGLSDGAVFEAAWSALRPGGRLVANAVSLATEARLIDLFGRHGGDLVRLEVSHAGKAGSGSVFVWRPAAPIIQWRVRKP
jgi:precorrin-6Y C5,15-methyltransferase (decarboxylating)